ncbi:MAG: PASTA domain-containing protein [Candidatus Kapabacteria bacterium]|nr:PASTA domain-containing protein [Candidatus Kapabacteria bacterium]
MHVAYLHVMFPPSQERRALVLRLSLALAGCIGVFVLLDQLVLPSVVHAGKTVTVPSLTGKTVDDALQLMVQNDLALVQPREQYSDKVPKGRIISQLPYAGALVKAGRRIYVTVSKGIEMATVPNVRGMNLRDARMAMMRAGLAIGDISYEASDSVEANRVLAQSTPSGQELSFGSVCHVVVSSGRAVVAVPDVRSLTVQQASAALAASGFLVGRIDYRSSSAFAANTVIDQSPGSDSLAAPGTLINLTVVR